MKKAMTIGFCLVSMICSSMAMANQAQPMLVQIAPEEQKQFDNRITLDPLGALIGFGGLTYSRALNDNLALNISPSGVYVGFDEDTKIYGASLGLGLSIYPNGDALRGFNLSVAAVPGFVTAKGAEENVLMFKGRAMIGYDWTWNNGFSMGLAAGAQYLYFGFDDGDDIDAAFEGVIPALDFKVGFAF